MRPAASSSMLSARRASPSAARASSSSAALIGLQLLAPESALAVGECAAQQRAEILNRRARAARTRARATSSALTTSNEGFSVVAPMKVSVPSSRYGRKVSCCALLKRCTSSRNSSVGRASWRARHARRLDRRADVLDAGHDRRERDELRVRGLRDEARQRRLAGARRSPEDERVQLARRRCSRRGACRRPAGAADRRTQRSCAGACGPRADAADRRRTGRGRSRGADQGGRLTGAACR